jgi:two-component system nitrogen regulation response regulator GlnG
VNYFLDKHARRQKQSRKSISEAALDSLLAHHWPGNVRELENIVQRAIVVAKGDAILPHDLPPEIAQIKAPTPKAVLPAAEKPLPAGDRAAPAGSPTVAAAGGSVPDTGAPSLASLAKTLFDFARHHSNLKILPAVERELLIHALNETKGNQVQAARLLGITRATLRKRVEKFKIKQELLVH